MAGGCQGGGVGGLGTPLGAGMLAQPCLLEPRGWMVEVPSAAGVRGSRIQPAVFNAASSLGLESKLLGFSSAWVCVSLLLGTQQLCLQRQKNRVLRLSPGWALLRVYACGM